MWYRLSRLSTPADDTSGLPRESTRVTLLTEARLLSVASSSSASNLQVALPCVVQLVGDLIGTKAALFGVIVTGPTGPTFGAATEAIPATAGPGPASSALIRFSAVTASPVCER